MSADGSSWTNSVVVDGQGSVTVDETDALLHVDAASNRIILGSQAAKTNVRTTAGNSVIPNFQKIATTLGNAAFLFLLDDALGINPPNFYLAKGRAGGAIVGNADRLGNLVWNASDGVNYIAAACIRGVVDGGVPGVDQIRGAITFETSRDSRVPTEAMRITSANELQMGGANTVIDGNRHFRLRAYTLATLPDAAAAAGQMIFCSDLGGGGGQLNSDGANWRRVSRGGQQTVALNAGMTLTTLASAEEIRHTGSLTANRIVTLSATNAYAGARFRVTRTGGGGSLLSVGGLKDLVQNSWCEVIFDGASWYLAAYGTL